MQVTFNVTDPKLQAAILASLGGTTAAAAQPKKRGRPSKAEVEAREAAEEDSDDTEDDSDGEGSDDTDDSDADTSDDEDDTEEASDDDDEAEAEDDEDEKPSKAAKAPALGDVLKAWKKFADKSGRPAAQKLLKKFKVKTIREIKPAQYPVFIKALKI